MPAFERLHDLHTGATGTKRPAQALDLRRAATMPQNSAPHQAARGRRRSMREGARRAQIDRGARRRWRRQNRSVDRYSLTGRRARCAGIPAKHGSMENPLVRGTVRRQPAATRTAAGGRRKDSSDRRWVEMMTVSLSWASTFRRSRKTPASCARRNCAVRIVEETQRGLAYSTHGRARSLLWPAREAWSRLRRSACSSRAEWAGGMIPPPDSRGRQIPAFVSPRLAEGMLSRRLDVEQIGSWSTKPKTGALASGRMYMAQIDARRP